MAKKKIIDPKEAIKAAAKKELFSSKMGDNGLGDKTNNSIENLSRENTNRRMAEGLAKKDSISAASSYKKKGRDLVDQKRAGNTAANATRKQNGVPAVTRFREHTGTNELADKYSNPLGSPTRDNYIRSSPVEKDAAKVKKLAINNAKSFVK